MDKYGMIFPGQGIQTIGMGQDFYQNFQEAREIFDHADHILNRNLSKLIFNGNIEELTQTSNAQPAIFITCFAILTTFLKQKRYKIQDIAKVIAGHSLGEYVALAASQSLKFESALQIVDNRSKAMSQFKSEHKCGMTAILGINYNTALQIIAAMDQNTICDIANDNSEEQIVISGYLNAIQDFCHRANKAGMKKAITLNVSGPFHSRLMIEASNKVMEVLNNINIEDARVPVIANYNVEIFNKENAKDLMAKQIFSTVRWRETINSFCEDFKVEKIIEIGPMSVLSRLAKTINPELTIHSLSRVEDLENMS